MTNALSGSGGSTTSGNPKLVGRPAPTDARPQHARLFGVADDPGPHDRVVFPLRGRWSGGLLPFGREVVGEEQSGSVEARGHAREVPTASRVSDRELHDVAGERARFDVERVAGRRVPAQDEQPLPGADQQLGHRPPPPEIEGRTWTTSSGASGASSPVR